MYSVTHHQGQGAWRPLPSQAAPSSFRSGFALEDGLCAREKKRAWLNLAAEGELFWDESLNKCRSSCQDSRSAAHLDPLICEMTHVSLCHYLTSFVNISPTVLIYLGGNDDEHHTKVTWYNYESRLGYVYCTYIQNCTMTASKSEVIRMHEKKNRLKKAANGIEHSFDTVLPRSQQWMTGGKNLKVTEVYCMGKNKLVSLVNRSSSK